MMTMMEMALEAKTTSRDGVDMRKITTSLLFTLLACSLAVNSVPAADKPNVLFISIDDLNDWIGCMGGHPQSITPNFDRLAASGQLFTNAHCAAPGCNPSRTAIMTGISPHRSGLYANEQNMRQVLPDAELLPKTFSRNGYWSSGSGKLLHYFIDARSWDEYFPEKSTENPFPFTYYPKERPVSLKKGGPWQYGETDWGPMPVDDAEFGGDWAVSDYIGKQLRREHDKPFFLACGIYRPHEPWFVPEKYFKPFPLESIKLPKGYKADDLDDLPPEGKRRGPNRYFAHIQAEQQWKQGIQGYLASIHFADAMLGRVLDALDEGPHKDNTVVMLWSDHGWHLGEKQHWQKFSPWRQATRVPLMVRVPKGTPGLPAGTKAGSVCGEPVSLLSLYPTLLELCDLPKRAVLDGPSIVPLLDNPTTAKWPHVARTYLSRPNNLAISTKSWRYIQYANGDEEFYHIDKDPNEWTNLAQHPEQAKQLEKHRRLVPEKFAAYKAPLEKHLPRLKWVKYTGKKPPASKPDGGTFSVHFINKKKKPVTLYWVAPNQELKSYGNIAPGKTFTQNSRPGAVWHIQSKEGEPLGHFTVGDRSANAIIPK